MDDPSVDWEIVNYFSSIEEDVEMTEKSSSKLDWIVNTGLSLGKKAVVAGFVITSVPIILPPLVVVSALGIASSVPFGLVFASYACTERIMSKLLPPSPSQKTLDYITGNEDEKNEAYMIPVDDDELTEKAQDSVDESPPRKDVEFLDTDKASGVKDVEDHSNRIDDNVREGDETKEGPVRNGEEKMDKNIVAEEPEKQQNASKGKNNSSKKKKKIAKRLGLSSGKETPVKKKDTQEMKKTPVEQSKEKENQRKEVTAPEKTVEIPSEQEKAKAQERKAVGDENQQHKVEQQQKAIVSEDRDETWREIDAIRVILGVKTPRNASIREELKELYLFTGVEPPSSNFSDFQNKLAFLKSVIGLK